MVKIIRDPRYSSNSLQHFGILGMKWGVRRYQNEDGTYTEKGKQRENLDNRNKTNNPSNKNKTPLFDKEEKKMIGKAIGVTAAIGLAAIGAKVVKDILNKADSKGEPPLNERLLSSISEYSNRSSNFSTKESWDEKRKAYAEGLAQYGFSKAQIDSDTTWIWQKDWKNIS